MNSVQANKEAFIAAVRNNIDREGVDEILDYLENSDFYIAPASTRYHGSYEGGLCEHSLNVFQSLIKEYEYLYGADSWPEYVDPESVAVVALFHDLCKVNTYSKYMRNVKNEVTKQWEQVECYKKDVKFPMGHGEKSMFIVMNYMAISPDEALAIRWHMCAFDVGGYNTVNELSSAYEKSELAFLLHIADMKTTYLIENRGEQ